MRRLGLVGLVCFLVLAATVPIATTASAFTLICSGKKTAEVAECDTSGYADVMHKMHWRMYGGHNCTNYAAYRMKSAGVPEPEILMGNARDWAANAKKLGYLVDKRPARGAIAHWSKAASHVAYVEEVGEDYLILSEDSYNSKTYRRYKAQTGDSWYPENFIHFKDVEADAEAEPAPEKLKSTVSVKAPSSISSALKPSITAEVQVADGSVPVGRLRIRQGGVTVTSVSLTRTAKGAVKVSIPKMNRGTQWISAAFEGNSKVQPAVSKSAKVQVTKPPKVVSSTTTIKVPSVDLAPESRASISLRVKSLDGRSMNNKISVYVNGKWVAAPRLKKAQQGKLSLALPKLAPGAHKVTAKYWGSKSVRRSTASAKTINVVEPTTTSATLAASSIRVGQPATLTVKVGTKRGVAPTVGNVQVRANGITVLAAGLAGAVDGTLTLSVPGLGAGVQKITVNYQGTRHQLASKSTTRRLVVTNRTKTTIWGQTKVAEGERAQVSIRVRDGDGAGLTEGKVRIYDGGKLISTASLTGAVNGKIVKNLPVLAKGKHRLKVEFVATELLETSTSAEHVLTVKN